MSQPAEPLVLEPSANDLRALRPAGGDVRRQRKPLGRRLRPAFDETAGLAFQARCRAHLQHAPSSPEPRQEQALPSNAVGRGLRAAHFPKPRDGAIRARRLARDLQLRAGRTKPSASPFRPTATGEPASLPGQTPRIRLWRGRDRANRSLFRGLHPIQGPLLESAGSLPGRTRRDQTDTANGCYGVFFASHHIAAIDLINPKTVGHVPEQLSAFSPE
jgi:hypothetical protein